MLLTCVPDGEFRLRMNNERNIQGGPKTGMPTLLSVLRQMLTDFHNSFTGGIVSKFPILAHRQNNAAPTVECDCLIAQINYRIQKYL